MKNILYIILFCIFFSQSISSYSQARKAYTLIVGLQNINKYNYLKKYKIQYDEEATAGVNIDCGVMENIALQNGHNYKILRDKAATKNKILKEIENIGKIIKRGDMFIFYFSGHGDIIKDYSGDEQSGFDQTLVAYDDYLIDDKINDLLVKYFTNTDNIMIVDACHSGTSYKARFFDFPRLTHRFKAISKSNEKLTINQNINFNNCNFNGFSTINEPYNLIYFGATADDKLAQGDKGGGLLTSMLDKVIKDAKYIGIWTRYSYRDLACDLGRKLEGFHQSFQYHEIGNNVKLYRNNQPFNLH